MKWGVIKWEEEEVLQEFAGASPRGTR